MSITPLARTQDEILAFLHAHDDLFGHTAEALLPYMDFRHADPYLMEASTRRQVVPIEGSDMMVAMISLAGGLPAGHGWTVEAWTKRDGRMESTREDVLARAQDYAPFAWERIKDHRLVSASRSVYKYAAWMFLLGRDDLVTYAFVPNNYAPLGAPVLAHICRSFGWYVPSFDACQRMIDGYPCSRDCPECLSVGAQRLDVVPAGLN